MLQPLYFLVLGHDGQFLCYGQTQWHYIHLTIRQYDPVDQIPLLDRVVQGSLGVVNVSILFHRLVSLQERHCHPDFGRAHERGQCLDDLIHRLRALRK